MVYLIIDSVIYQRIIPQIFYMKKPKHRSQMYVVTKKRERVRAAVKEMDNYEKSNNPENSYSNWKMKSLLINEISRREELVFRLNDLLRHIFCCRKVFSVEKREKS